MHVTITVIVYVVVVIIIWFALSSELYDTRCADIRGKVCGEGKGRAYYNSAPEEGDSKEVLLDKLSATAKYDFTAIHWRRAMLGAILAAFLGGLFILGKPPPGKIFAITIIIIFLACYSGHILYQENIVRPATHQVDEIIAML